jgi:hypothetical protein
LTGLSVGSLHREGFLVSFGGSKDRFLACLIKVSDSGLELVPKRGLKACISSELLGRARVSYGLSERCKNGI